MNKERCPKTAMRTAALLLLLLLLGDVTACRQVTKDTRTQYLIIAPRAATAAVADFAAYKETRGFNVTMAALEDILAETDGADEPQQLQNYIREQKNLIGGRLYVLLVGSPEAMPMRITYPNASDHGITVPTDFYYEYLDGNWDADGDGFYGEYGDDMGPLTDTYSAGAFTGRIPWDDPVEISAICATSMRYEQERSLRMRRALGGGGSLEIGFSCDGPFLMALTKSLLLAPAGYHTTALYDQCGSFTPEPVLSAETFVAQWETLEPGFVVWFAHGNPNGTFFINVDNLPRDVAPAIATSVSCSVADPDTESLARLLVRSGACAAYLGAGRDDYIGIDPSPILTSGFKAATDLLWRRRPLAEAKISFIENYIRREQPGANITGWRFHQNLFLFMLYGDPAIRLH
ncbi:C25 family cysteine peptidase [Thermodesulfobacteriota bacterium]